MLSTTPYPHKSWRRGFPPSHLPSQAICLGLQQTINKNYYITYMDLHQSLPVLPSCSTYLELLSLYNKYGAGDGTCTRKTRGHRFLRPECLLISPLPHLCYQFYIGDIIFYNKFFCSVIISASCG